MEKFPVDQTNRYNQVSVDGKMSILGQSVTKYPAALEYFLSQPQIAEFD